MSTFAQGKTIGYAGAVETQPGEPSKQVPSLQNELGMAVAAQRELLQKLAIRLEPILRPIPPQDANSKGAPRPVEMLCSVAEYLKTQLESVTDHNHGLEFILSRIEL